MGFFDRGRGPAATTSRTGASGGGSKGNKGEGNAKDGYPFGSTTPGYIDYRDIEANGPFYEGTTRQRYQDDPNARKKHSPGSARGQQSGSGFRAPTPVDPEDYVEHSYTPTAAQQALWDSREAEWKQMLANDPDYAAAKAAGDLKAQSRAMMRLKQANAKKRTMDKYGMSEETYDNRFKTSWPVPRSRNGEYWYRPPGARGPDDPGVRGPTPPNVAGGGGGNDAANTPSSGRELNDWMRATETPKSGGRGGMIEGYQGSSGASTGQSDVLAALSRLQGLPIGAPTAATNAPGGFARAASPIPPAVAMAGSGAPKKPTIVRRGGGVVSRG